MPRNVPRKVLYSLSVLLLWLSFVVEGSHALFTSAATLTSSNIMTGTSMLTVSNSQDPSPTDFQTSAPGFTFTISPGTSQQYYFSLQNSSPSQIDLDIDASVANANLSNGIADATTLTFTPVDSLGSPTAEPSSATLTTLLNQHKTINSTVLKGGQQRYLVKASLAPTFTAQSLPLSFDIVLTGTQHYVQ